jgi:hypothetical protein
MKKKLIQPYDTHIAFNQHGEEIARGNVEQVATAMLQYDTNDFEIRRKDGAWRLFVTEKGGGGNVTKREWPNYKSYDKKSKIFENVLYMGGVCNTHANSLSEYVESLLETIAELNDEIEKA